MKHDTQPDNIIRQEINAELSFLDSRPSLHNDIMSQIKGEKVVNKKVSLALVFVLILLLTGTVALAATLLWQDAGEKVALMEGKNGYYDTWNTEEKMKLVRTLYELGELKDNPDAVSVLNSEDMPDSEKNALCDRIMCAYVSGTPDTVTLLSILEKLHGDMSTWSMEDLVWYNGLLATNDMLSAEDTNYVLPQTGEITQEQAIEAAKTFLMSIGAANLDEAQIEATMYEETDDYFYGDTQVSQKGRRMWSVVFRLEEKGLPYGGTCHVDIATDGSVITYTLPELEVMFLTGILPDIDAIPEVKAVEIGTKAIAAQLFVPKEKLTDAKAYFGYINLADEEAAHAQFGAHVWLIDTDQYYALVSPSGDVIFVGSHDVRK